MVEVSNTSTGKRSVWPVVALAAGLLLSLIWFVHPYYEPVNDASLYILTARSILAGEGYAYQGVPFIIRPPAFSLLLALVLRLWGTNFLILNLLVSLFGVACITAMFATFRERLGSWTCLAMCLFIWTSSAWQRLCNQVLSDVPGAALMFGCILLDRWAARSPSWRRHILLGLAISVAMYFRTLNVILIPAVLCARAAEHFLGGAAERPAWRWKPLLAVVLIPMLCQVPWNLRNADIEVPIPPQHVYLHSYSAAMWHTRPEDPNSPAITASEFLTRIPERLSELLPAVGGRLESSRPKPENMVFGIVGLGLWLVALVRRRGTVEFLAGGAVLVLSIYFAFKVRLALPAYLLLLPCALDTLQWGLAKASGEKWARVLVAGALVVGTISWYKPLGQWPDLRENHEQYLEVARLVDRRFPGGEPVAAPHGWHYGVYLDRRVYSMRIIATRQGQAAALGVIAEHDVVGVLVSSAPDEQRYLAWYRSLFAEERTPAGHYVFKVR
jgi:hypothetical protein